MGETNDGRNRDSTSPAVRQYNEELASQKNQYTLVEAVKLLKKGAIIKPYQREKDNLLIYNGSLYEKRKENYKICSSCQSELIVCPSCQKELPLDKEFWWILGKRIKKEEGRNIYTLEETTELLIRGVEIKDFQGGKENLLRYNVGFDLLLYEKRKDNNRRICPNCDSEITTCPNCHSEQPYEEFWFILGEGIEKKEGGLEQNIKKEGGNPKL